MCLSVHQIRPLARSPREVGAAASSDLTPVQNPQRVFAGGSVPVGGGGDAGQGQEHQAGRESEAWQCRRLWARARPFSSLGLSPLLCEMGCIPFPVAGLTASHKLRGLSHTYTLLRVKWKRQQLCSLPGGPGENPFSCLSQLLETAHLAWLTAPSSSEPAAASRHSLSYVPGL